MSAIRKNFPVLRMTCASCAMSVQNVLKAQPGVINAGVNFASNMADVEYLSDQTTPAKLQRAVQSVGYDILIEESTEENNALEKIQQKNYNKLKLRTAGAIIFSLPTVCIGMLFMNITHANYLMWALSTPVVFWYGKDFFTNAWQQAKHLTATMDTLVALSTGVAYLFSIFNTLFPQYLSKHGFYAHVYFEAAAVVISFVLLGRLLEEKAKGNTAYAIKKLIGLKPETVSIVTKEGTALEMPVEKVMPGDTIQVRPGEKIAVDGIVTEGESYVDESMLSGEPIPVLKKKGEKVFAGTINRNGNFLFTATSVGAQTMLSQIIRMVQQAQGSKPPVQKLVDKIAGIFVPVVIAIALLTFIVWWISGGQTGFEHGLMAMVTVLVIACPCALGLATPTAIMVGIGKGAEKGILIKDAESLELAQKVTAVVLDKTGTITEGRPEVTEAYWLNEDNYLKQVLLTIESKSQHPLAQALIKHLEGNIPVLVSKFGSITGKGVQAEVIAEKYFVGTRSLLIENGVKIQNELLLKEKEWNELAYTVVWFADSNNVLALIAITDKVKSTSKQAVQQLQQAGIEVYMLTGDNEATAHAIALQTGIKRYKAQALPQQKADFIKELQAKGKTVAMVGDGINDSSALAQADVSIAMGKGSDIAIDVAKMTIISSDLAKIPQAINISKQTVNTVRQNLFWAFIYNILGIPVAAGILYPFTGFMLNPMVAGAAMAMSSVSVVSNSLRLKWKMV